ncbi:hypothetical protein [Acidipropionibacterium virtanenii]|uniref:Uncharacterized protein n=1 Tax=Acidipropionibacterium virtanenii TaxID=2057246 RepID=A0A344UR61_9ACTN|nr:hypothetical protein [Acidipropionibacterium virtanenii]AXE37759.1 hypothetical protein JS278_00566 [Acidipropionibacterium virtanenii]
MSLFDHDALQIDRLESFSRDPLTIWTPSGRPVAVAEAASRRNIINWGPKAWRLVENGRTVMTIRDPRHLGRDKFVIEDASGHRLAKVTLTIGTYALIVEVADGFRLKTSTAAGFGAATLFFHDDRKAAEVINPGEDAEPERQVIRFAPSLPPLYRGAILGTAVIAQMLQHKSHLSDLLS